MGGGKLHLKHPEDFQFSYPWKIMEVIRLIPTIGYAFLQKKGPG